MSELPKLQRYSMSSTYEHKNFGTAGCNVSSRPVPLKHDEGDWVRYDEIKWLIAMLEGMKK